MSNNSSSPADGSMTTTDAADVPSQLEQTIVASTFAVMSGVSLTSYIFLFAVILSSKELRSSSFFLMIFSISINDACVQLVYLVIAVPSSYLGFVYSDVANFVATTLTLEIPWFHNSILIVFLSFNRLVSLCYPERYDAIFGGRRIWFFIGTAWLIGLTIGSATFWPCCYNLYFPDIYAFSYNIPVFGSTVISYLDLSYTFGCLGLATVVHAIIFRDIYKRHRSIANASETQFQRSRRKRETNMFLQMFATTAMLLAGDLAFVIVPNLTTSRIGSFALSLFNIVCMSSNSFIFLLFNTTVNNEAKHLLRRMEKLLRCC